MPSFSYTERDPLRRIKQAFLALPNTVNRFCVGFSGGLDSHVLLHTTRQLLPQKCVTAIHINHGLQSQATHWEQHCQTVCDALGVPLIICSVKEHINQYKKAGHSPEDAARKARYIAFSDLLDDTSCLLTGHHLEDQSETLLLQLMRGAGIKGLGSMRLLRKLQGTYHLRPLLYWTYEERLAYAKAHQLQWIDDLSNHDQKFMRNFVRHTVIPTLKRRWPNPAQTLGRSAMHCSEASDLCIELATNDLLSCELTPRTLSIQALLKLSLLRRRNALRYWLYRNINQYPNAIHFEKIEQLLYTKPNDGSTFSFHTITIKRYRDNLYAVPKDKEGQQPLTIQWHTDKPLTLPNGDTLAATQRQGQGICLQLLQDNPLVEVRFRQGGERFQPQGRIGSHPLKKLFQEWAILPWERYQWPLIYYNSELLAIPGYAVSEKSVAHPKELGLWITITRSTTMTV